MDAAMGQATSNAKRPTKRSASAPSSARPKEDEKSNRARPAENQSQESAKPKAAKASPDKFDRQGNKPSVKREPKKAHANLAAPLMQQPAFLGPGPASVASDAQEAGKSLLDGLGHAGKQLSEYWHHNVAGVFGGGGQASPFGEVPGVFRAADKKSNAEEGAGNGAPSNVDDGAKGDASTKNAVADVPAKKTKKMPSKSRSVKKTEKIKNGMSDYRDILVGTQKLDEMNKDHLTNVLKVLKRELVFSKKLFEKGLGPKTNETDFLGSLALKDKVAKAVHDELRRREEATSPPPTFREGPVQPVQQKSETLDSQLDSLPVFSDEKHLQDMSRDFAVVTMHDVAQLGLEKFIKNPSLRDDLTVYLNLLEGNAEFEKSTLDGKTLRAERRAEENPNAKGSAELNERVAENNSIQKWRSFLIRNRYREQVVFIPKTKPGGDIGGDFEFLLRS
jgi:hypothetical protein